MTFHQVGGHHMRRRISSWLRPSAACEHSSQGPFSPDDLARPVESLTYCAHFPLAGDRPHPIHNWKVRPMSFSMSEASLPVFEIGLNALLAVLDKAAAHATAKKIDLSVLLNSRLAPDMFALTRQVQIATDQAKNGSARLAGVEPPSYEDNETTMDRSRRALRKQSPT